MEPKIPIARDLMEKVHLTVPPDMNLLEAIDELARHGMSAAPVVDKKRRLLGMLTEKDCLRILSVSAFHRDQGGGKVSEFSSDVRQLISPDMDLFRISELFLDSNFPMLPVVEDGKLVGCITRQNMLHGIIELGEEIEQEREKLESAADGAKRPTSIEKLQQVFSSHSKEQLVRRLGRRS